VKSPLFFKREKKMFVKHICAFSFEDLEEKINKCIHEQEDFKVLQINYFNMENDNKTCSAFVLFDWNYDD